MTWRLARSPCATITKYAFHNLRSCTQPIQRHPHRRPLHHNYTTTAYLKAPPRLYTHAQLRNLSEPAKGNGSDHASPTIAVAGLVRSIRKQKKVAFAHVSDGSTLEPIQAVLSPDQAKDITNGSYIELYGDWKLSPGQGQAHELHVTEVARIGESDPEEFPIQKKTQTQEFLRTLPHLRFRTPLYSLVARARSVLTAAASDFYNTSSERPAIQVHPPLITSSDCEGAGEVFTVTPRNSPAPGVTKTGEVEQLFFRDPKYLTVSSQLHLEAYSAELGNVWTLSPTFRAEESDTPRHLAEFYMLEAEFRSMTSLSDLMDQVEHLIKSMISSFRNSSISTEIENYYDDPKHQSESNLRLDRDALQARWSASGPEKWQRLPYTTAIDMLKSHHDKHPNHFTYKPSYDEGLHLEHERHLVEFAADKRPLFVTDYPRHIKPFYMLPSSEATDYQSPSPITSTPPKTVACFDLLFPYGTAELVGGSLREHRLPNLINSMREKGIIKHVPAPSDTLATTYPHLQPTESLGSLQWYTDLRRFGSAPHGGFGMGFDRLLAYLTGAASVRDTVGFPRWHGRADC